MTAEVQAELKGHKDSVTCVAFSADGNQVVSGSHDKTVWVWNTMTGEVQTKLEGHTNSVSAVEFSQDGSQVVSGSYDNTIRIWDTMTGVGHIMTTPIIKLPDSSEVYSTTATGEFNIVHPAQLILSIHPMLSLSVDHQWIVSALHDCWIPPYDSNFYLSSFSGNKACFGYTSGRVVILDMTIAGQIRQL
jgi:WD40 repeat protein